MAHSNCVRIRHRNTHTLFEIVVSLTNLARSLVTASFTTLRHRVFIALLSRLRFSSDGASIVDLLTAWIDCKPWTVLWFLRTVGYWEINIMRYALTPIRDGNAYHCWCSLDNWQGASFNSEVFGENPPKFSTWWRAPVEEPFDKLWVLIPVERCRHWYFIW